MTIWVVRGGREGEREQYCLDHALITIGWEWLPDLSDINTREESNEIYDSNLPELPKLSQNAISQYKSMVWSFIYEMKQGDLVIYPLKSSVKFHIGLISGDYVYDDKNEHAHRRPITWLDIDINLIPQELQTWKKVPKTIFKIKNKELLELIGELIIKNQDKLDEDLLVRRLQEWVGYGSLEGKIWFLGMEEGGATSLQEQRIRLSLEPVSDIKTFHDRLQNEAGVYAPWFDEDAKLQKTYSGLIRIYLCVMGLCGYSTFETHDQNANREKIRSYQRDEFGRSGGDHLVCELMPLSSKDLGAWKYKELSDREDLSDRETYKKIWMPKRKELFHNLIDEYQPKIIIAYGKKYWNEYRSLVEDAPQEDIIEGIAQRYGKLILVQHTSISVKSEIWQKIGHWIKEKIL